MNRAQPFEIQPVAFVVVIGDVVLDAVAQAVDALEVTRIKSLGFERGEEAFRGGAVEAISLT